MISSSTWEDTTALARASMKHSPLPVRVGMKASQRLQHLTAARIATAQGRIARVKWVLNQRDQEISKKQNLSQDQQIETYIVKTQDH